MAAQLDIVFAERRDCIVPDAQTQRGKILRYLRNGGTLTVGEALSLFGCYALSQRCGELRRAGWPVQSMMVDIKPGTRVARYWMDSNGV